MHTQTDPSTPAPNAFSHAYLALIADRDDPVTGAEADVAGPWHLEPFAPAEGWAVLRQSESLASHQPRASFKNRDTARLAAAVLPCTGRRRRYRLGPDAAAHGYPVLDDGQVVGHLQHFDSALIAALNIVDAIVSIPGDLAWLLDAAGGPALDHAGQIALDRAHPDF